MALFCLAVCEVIFFCMVATSSEKTVARVGVETDSKALDLLRRLPRNVLFVEPFHGLGNRLRAYACAAALAKLSSRHLVVVWIQDPHVNASMSALFDTSNLTVIDFPVAHLLSQVWTDVKKYDYNSKRRKDEIVQDKTLVPIYVRSAYVLQSQTRVGEAEISNELNSLAPSAEVQKRANRLYSFLVAKENLVGVHIRMETDIKRDVPGIGQLPSENPAGTTHMGPVERERSRCHYEAFIPHLEKFLQGNPRVKFFVASDSSLAVYALRQRYPGHVISSDARELAQCEGESRRGTSCLQSCLAEFLVLSKKTSTLILSDWSSASELIIRLSRDKVPHKVGCFAKSAVGFNGWWKEKIG
jgi:hypothetical protein